ncbi:hypothetical protein HYS94_00320 [Candidatus Daviesbacteria bacterium]|nr:hypothetical protein [Candidatus Daviesbacteria bacterium]
MPTAIFDSFDNLDQISIENLANWLKPAPAAEVLENHLANRILYPQAVAMTAQEMRMDLAILREALRVNGPRTIAPNSSLLGANPFLNIILRKVLIPRRFLSQAGDLTSLTWAFLDGLLLNRPRQDVFQDIWTVILTDDVEEIVGSIILPQFSDRNDLLELKLLGKNYKIKAGSLTVIPCPKDKCEIGFKFLKGKILGQVASSAELYGGSLGLMIDGRMV